MLSEFIAKNLKKARYKILDDNTYFGEIPGLDGVWANAKNLEDCRAELQDVLEGWQVVLPGSGPEGIRTPTSGCQSQRV